MVSTTIRRVGASSSGSAATSRSASSRCQAVRLVVIGRALGGQQLERREPHPGQPVGRPAVAPVGSGERLGVGQPGTGSGPAGRRRRQAARAAPAASAATAAGSAARAAAPTAAYWSRSSSSALTLHGSSSASSSSQDGVELVEQAGRLDRRAQPVRAAASVSAGGEERPAGPGVDRAGVRRAHRTGPGDVLVAADQQRPPASPCASPRTPPRSTPSARYALERLLGVLEQVAAAVEVATGLIVGGRYSSQRGSTANRLITSSAAAAFSSRTPIRRWYAVSTTRRARARRRCRARRARARAGAGSGVGFDRERPGRLVADPLGRDGDELPLRDSAARSACRRRRSRCPGTSCC